MAVFALYTSDDLITWEAQEPIYRYPIAVSGDCPNIFAMDGRWYIIAADYHYTTASEPGGPYAKEIQPKSHAGEMDWTRRRELAHGVEAGDSKGK